MWTCAAPAPLPGWTALLLLYVAGCVSAEEAVDFCAAACRAAVLVAEAMPAKPFFKAQPPNHQAPGLNNCSRIPSIIVHQ